MMWFLLGVLIGSLLWSGILLCFCALRGREKAAEEAKRIREAKEAEKQSQVFHFRRTGRIRPPRTTLTDRYRAFLLE